MKIFFLMIAFYIFLVGAIYLYRKTLVVQQVFHGDFVTNGKTKIWTELFGKKENTALLLIGGAMSPARIWSDAFCSYIAQQGYFVIRYDLRDMGYSSDFNYENNPYDLTDLVDDAVAILKHFNIEKTFAVGISMGSSIAQLLALQYPELCAGIILISSPTPGIKLSAKEEAKLEKTWEVFRENQPTINFEESYPGFLKSYTYLNGAFSVDEQMVKEYVRDMYERTNFLYEKEDDQIKAFEDPHNHVRAQMHSNITLKDLTKITTPTFIIQGKLDPIVFPVNAQVVAQTIKDAKLLVIEKMGHMIFNRELEKRIADSIVTFTRNK